MDRRTFLRRGVAGSTAVGLAGVAGCTLPGGNDGNGGDIGSRYYDSLADPRPEVSPRFFVGYEYDAGDLLSIYDPAAIMPKAAGDLFANVIAEVDGVEPSDVDRITASRYRQIGNAAGADLTVIGPEGQGLSATGDFGPDPMVEYFSNQEIDDLGSYEDYRRFGVKRDTGEDSADAEVAAVSADSYVFGERLNIPEGPDAEGVDPESVIVDEIDAVSDPSGAVREMVPEFVAAADAVEGESIHAAAQYDLVTLGADTGVEAFDEAVIGLSSSGIGVTVDDGVTIERGLVYFAAEHADGDAVENAFAAAAEGDGEIDEADADWEIEVDGRTVLARTTLSEDAVADRPAMLHTPVPVPGYDDMFEVVDTGAIGREPLPRVALRPELVDGRISIEHVGGIEIDQEVVVRYVSDGEQQEESWEPPITDGDGFETSETVDTGTDLIVVWRPGTPHATVLLRVNVPE